jgi:hypothetical protein
VPRSLAEIAAVRRRYREMRMRSVRYQSTFEPEMLGDTGYAFETREHDCREHDERFIDHELRVYEPKADCWVFVAKVNP